MTHNSNGPVDAIDFHNRIAASWDEKYLSRGFRRRATFFEREILPLIANSGTWLDAGCGSGYFSRMLSDKGVSVTGVDGSRAMIESATDLAEKSANPALLKFNVIETIERLPFEDASFEGCICLSVIEYTTCPDSVMDELSRVLKRDGIIVISIPERRSFIRKVQSAIMSVFRNTSVCGNYMNFSRFSIEHDAIITYIAKRDLVVKKIVGFDPILPECAHWYLRPSLLYVIATKGGR